MINAVVLMILAVSLVSPALVERAGSALVRASEREAYDPRETPQRILVPVSSDSRHTKSLLGLAFTIRDRRSDQPIYAVSVVQPNGAVSTEARVAEAETIFDDLESYASGAEVPIEDNTRVNHNVASGIVQSAVENRITTLVIGWDGARSRVQHVFGHVIDQVLSRTEQLTLVGRVREPLNTTERIVLILPPRIEDNAGFFEALHTVKLVSEETGAPIRALAVDGEPDRFEHLFDRVEPDVPVTFERTADWKSLLSTLRDDVGTDDLVVCLSSRRDDIGWHPELQTLPKSISTLTDGNFIVMYSASEERADDRRFLRFD